MNLDTPPGELNLWLDRATAKLPAPVANSVRNELEAHYLDAVEAHIADMMDDTEARCLALADLGDAALTAIGLERIHFSRNRCFLSTLVCLAYPAALFCTSLLAQHFNVYQTTLFLCITSTTIILYILHAYKALIHTSIKSLDRPILMLSIGQVLWTLIAIFYYLLYKRLPIIGPGETLHWDFSVFETTIMDIGMVVGDVMSGIGALWMGINLLREEPSSMKLTWQTGLLLIVVGGVNLLGNLSALFGWASWVYLSSKLGNGIVAVGLVIMAYFFWISASRSSSRISRVT